MIFLVKNSTKVKFFSVFFITKFYLVIIAKKLYAICKKIKVLGLKIFYYLENIKKLNCFLQI